MYTRTGDKGETGLFSGERVPKNSIRVEAYGTVDELSSWIGYVRTLVQDEQIGEVLEGVQRDLFLVSADLATQATEEKPKKAVRVTEEMVKNLEEEIDRLDAELPQLPTFIFPIGTQAAAALHIVRTVARRAERRTVALAKQEDLNQQLVPYLNRLSSLLYVFARVINKRSGVDETKWSLRTD